MRRSGAQKEKSEESTQEKEGTTDQRREARQQSMSLMSNRTAFDEGSEKRNGKSSNLR